MLPSSGKLTLPREMISVVGVCFCEIIVTNSDGVFENSVARCRTSAKGGCEGVVATLATAITLKLIPKQGIVGLYKGTGATMMRDVTFSVIYFPLFANLNAKGFENEAVFLVYFYGWLRAAAFTVGAVTLLDVVKTHLQVLKKSHGERVTLEFKTLLCNKIFREEGFTAFFKGAAAFMIVMSPLFGIAQMVYFLGVVEWTLGIKK